MNLLLCLPLTISLLAPVPANKSGATKNRKSQVGKQSTSKRTVKRRRGNIKRTNRRRHNRKYELKRRRKAGGTITGQRNSRATNNIRKRTTNRVRKNQHSHQHQSSKKKVVPSKRKRSARSPVHLSPLQKQMLMLQMEVLLSDPEMGPIYRQIIDSSKKTK